MNDSSPQAVFVYPGCALVVADVFNHPAGHADRLRLGNSRTDRQVSAGDAVLVPLVAEFPEVWFGFDAYVAAHPESDDEPELNALAERCDSILRTMRQQPAEGVVGLCAKAEFMLTLERLGDRESMADVGLSLATDLLRLLPTGPPV